MHSKSSIVTIVSVFLVIALIAQGAMGQVARKSAPRGASTAEEAFNRGDWETAVRGFEDLVKTTPGNADYRLKLGIALLASGHPSDAVVVLRQTLKLSPMMAAARQYLGAALAEAGRCSDAIPMLKKDLAEMRNPDLKRAAGLAGVRCAMGMNRPEDAVDFIRLLVRDFPQDAEVLYQAVHVYSDLSLRASQDLLFKAPASHQVRLLNAEALETQERWNDAAMEYRTILAQNPNLPGIHYRLGRLLLSLPEGAATEATRDEAKREFEEELNLNPRNAGAEYVLGELARQARNWSGAIDHFSKAADLNPTFADTFIGLGRSLIADRKFTDAVAPLEHATKLQPDNPAAHYHLAIAYSRSGRKEEAEKESAAFRQASDKASQMKQAVQTGILGPQKAEP